MKLIKVKTKILANERKKRANKGNYEKIYWKNWEQTNFFKIDLPRQVLPQNLPSNPSLYTLLGKYNSKRLMMDQ